MVKQEIVPPPPPTLELEDFSSLEAATGKRVSYLARCLQQVNEAHILEMKWHFPNESDKDDDMKAFLAKAVDSRELTPQTIFPFLADVSYLNVWRNVIACCNTYMNRTDEPGRDPWSEVKARALIFVDLRREIVTAFEEAKPRLQGFEDALYGTQMKIVVLDSYVAMYQRTNKREEKISIERWKAGMTSKPFTDEQDGATASPVMDLKKVTATLSTINHLGRFGPLLLAYVLTRYFGDNLGRILLFLATYWFLRRDGQWGSDTTTT